MKMDQNFSKYVGRKYEEYNCLDLVKEFYLDQFGIEIKNYFDGPPPSRKEVENLIVSNRGEFVKVPRPEFGDIVVINLYGMSCHIGVCITRTKFLHSARGAGSCMEALSRYETLIDGFYRHQERAELA